MTIQNQNIVDRVVDRIKKQPLGDLITEEDLYDIVKEAIPKAFFEERVNPNRGYNTPSYLPPLIVEVMRDVLKPTVEAAAKKWIDDNPEHLLKWWMKVLDENIVTYVNNIVEAKATAIVRNGLQPWIQSLNDERQKEGKPPVYF